MPTAAATITPSQAAPNTIRAWRLFPFEAYLRLDNTDVGPEAAAQRIAGHFGLITPTVLDLRQDLQDCMS